MRSSADSRRRLLLGITLAVSLVAGFVAPAVATHTFPDVSPTSAFHTEVGNIAGAGIATGFPDGTYRPTESVNRQQMAAFLNRSAGRAGHNTALALNDPLHPAYQAITSITVEAGATDSGNGFVLVTTAGSIEVETDTLARIRVRAEPGGSLSPDNQIDLEIGNREAFGLTWLFPIFADQTLTFTLEWSTSPQSNTFVSGQLTGLYVPFSGDGDGDL